MKAIAVRILTVDGNKWTCRCAACSYTWNTNELWIPSNITDFKENLRIANEHLKTCKNPITWSPSKGMTHETWLVRFL